MKTPIMLLVIALAVVGLVPLTASAHQSCTADPAGDAAPGYDVGEVCASAGDEDPVELTAATDAPADDVVVQWDAEAFAVVYDHSAGTVGVTGEGGEFVPCEGTTAEVEDGVAYLVTVPAECLPEGEHDVRALTFGAGGTQDQTATVVGVVPAPGTVEPQPEPTEAEDAGYTRLAGPSRIETAIALSQDSYPEGAEAVLLASADNPVDALPASRAIAYEGPILYVPACGTLPQAVAEEITRLGAEEVVVLGGEGAICDDIAAEAAAARAEGGHGGGGHGGGHGGEHEGHGGGDEIPADEVGAADLREAEFELLPTRPEQGYEQAGGIAMIARTDDDTTVTIEVEGLLADTAYVSHVHEGSCADGGGAHFRYDPDGGDTPPNEIHLDFTTDELGEAEVTAVSDRVAPEDARSIVVHPADDGPAKVICAEWPAA